MQGAHELPWGTGNNVARLRCGAVAGREFKFSPDPELPAKVTKVLGPYLPPSHGMREGYCYPIV